MSLPVWAPEEEALAFLRDREDWVRDHLDRAPPLRIARIGAAIPVGGRPMPVIAGPGRVARIEAGRILVPHGPHQGPRIKALLTAMARERLRAAVEIHAIALGRSAGKLTLRDPRTRWGSCSSKGDLMFSFRLVMAPPEILDYVAAHETAHLAEMNHGPAFWSLCRKLCPQTDTHRHWLREHGSALLAWRFETADGD
jgi:predicted metal-dependent hydrolase